MEHEGIILGLRVRTVASMGAYYFFYAPFIPTGAALKVLPGVYDIPQRVDSIIVEEPHPDGPFGARGMGEMPYLPYAPVIAAAVFDAIGVWFDEFPLTPERVLRGLGKVRSRL